MNIFRQHRQKVLAEQAAKSAAGSTAGGDTSPAPQANLYDQMLAAIAAHKVELKAIQSVQSKAVKKRDFLGDYTAYVEGILTADEKVQDDVVMTIFVWAMDAGDMELALRIAEWAIKHDISPPPEFSRTVPTLLAEQFAEAALSDRDNIANYADNLAYADELMSEADMPDSVRAKLYKACGLAQYETDPEASLIYLQKAVTLNPKIGVKRDIETLERRLKKDTKLQSPETQASPGAAPATVKPQTDPSTSSEALTEGGADGDVATDERA